MVDRPPSIANELGDSEQATANLSEPQFANLQIGAHNVYLQGLFGSLNEIMCVRCLPYLVRT